MEIWKAAFPGMIPEDKYQTQLSNGEEKGLVIKLKGKKHEMLLKFGAVQAVRMLDEGIVQMDLYSGQQFDILKKEGFKDVIYEVVQGEFEKQIRKISAGYVEVLKEKHYVIITQNYNIDIITEWKPEIDIVDKN